MNNIKYNINSYKRISNINNNFKWQTQNSLIIYNVYPKMTRIITIRFHRSSSPTSSPLFQRSKLLSSHQPSPYVLHKHLAANREYFKLNLVPTWLHESPESPSTLLGGVVECSTRVAINHRVSRGGHTVRDSREDPRENTKEEVKSDRVKSRVCIRVHVCDRVPEATRSSPVKGVKPKPH